MAASIIPEAPNQHNTDAALIAAAEAIVRREMRWEDTTPAGTYRTDFATFDPLV